MQVMFLNRLYFNWVNGSCLQLCWNLRHLWLNSAFVFEQKVNRFFSSFAIFICEATLCTFSTVFLYHFECVLSWIIGYHFILDALSIFWISLMLQLFQWFSRMF